MRRKRGFFALQIQTENWRTRRSSEREPADSFRDESIVIGGWRPSLTFALDDMLSVGGYTLKIDPSATRDCYGRGVAGPASCNCWYCRNWIAGRERLLPVEVRELLSQLGVPNDGEIEVWEVPGDSTPHGYGGWYMFVGAVTNGPPDTSREFLLGGWRLWFSPRPSYPVDAFENQSVSELHFFTWADTYIDDAELNVV